MKGEPVAAWVQKVSAYSVAQTLGRLEVALIAEGFKVMARVDHSGHAEKSGLVLRPTQVLLFGKPSLGTRLMQADQKLAIDLPSKALAWQDVDGTVRLGYRDLRVALAGRDGLATARTAIDELADAIDRATDTATVPG